MCSVHYERWYTHGDPHFMLRPTPGTRSATCTVEIDGAACGLKVVAHEMCAKHYRHWSTHGDPLAGRFENPGARCSVVEDDEPCPREAVAGGMCNRHYRRWKKYGDPLKTIRIPTRSDPPPASLLKTARSAGAKWPPTAYAACIASEQGKQASRQVLPEIRGSSSGAYLYMYK